MNNDYNISINNVKKSVLNFFDAEKKVLHCKNFHLYLKKAF